MSSLIQLANLKNRLINTAATFGVLSTWIGINNFKQDDENVCRKSWQLLEGKISSPQHEAFKKLSNSLQCYDGSKNATMPNKDE